MRSSLGIGVRRVLPSRERGGNRGTRFTTPGGTLTDPHLIRPGWTLRLPADVARPKTQPNAPPAASSPPP